MLDALKGLLGKLLGAGRTLTEDVAEEVVTKAFDALAANPEALWTFLEPDLRAALAAVLPNAALDDLIESKLHPLVTGAVAKYLGQVEAAVLAEVDKIDPGN